MGAPVVIQADGLEEDVDDCGGTPVGCPVIPVEASVDGPEADPAEDPADDLEFVRPAHSSESEVVVYLRWASPVTEGHLEDAVELPVEEGLGAPAPTAVTHGSSGRGQHVVGVEGGMFPVLEEEHLFGEGSLPD